MTINEISNKRNENGAFIASNVLSGWYAVSREGIHMITFFKGHYTFSKKDDVYKFYTEKGFAKKVTILMNGGW